MNQKTQEQQIQELTETVKCRIGVSKVSGVGIIAIRDIKKGEQLHCRLEAPIWYTVTYDNLTLLPPEIRQLILDRWSNVINGQPFLSPNHDAIMICFCNHSDTPNYDPFSDCATEDIPKGCEVFENYRVAKNADLVYPWLKVIPLLTTLH